MTKVFQVFNLNFEELDKVEDKKLFGLNPPEAVKNLIQELKTKGYEVLEGSISHSGIPTSLIVGTELFPDQDLKLDFYSIADRLGLRWFISGEVYLETA